MTQDDVSHFLPYVAEYCATHMKDPSLRKKHIWSIDKAIEAMQTNLTQPKTGQKQTRPHSVEEGARRQLNDYKSITPMPESQEFKGVLPRVYAKFITRIFVKSTASPTAGLFPTTLRW